MAFFDEIGKKITQTSQDAVQKTKDMAETVRLNGLIADEEKQIQAAYLQIGKAYYEAFGENPDERFAQPVTKITDAKAIITAHQERINQLKGAVPCTKCGQSVPPNAPFCSACGTPNTRTALQAQVAAAMTDGVTCQTCGALMPPDNDFCTGCGSRLEKLEPQVTEVAVHIDAAEEQEESSAIQPEEQKPEMEDVFSHSNNITCSSCGKELSDIAVFCTGCGQKVEV